MKRGNKTQSADEQEPSSAASEDAETSDIEGSGSSAGAEDQADADDDFNNDQPDEDEDGESDDGAETGTVAEDIRWLKNTMATILNGQRQAPQRPTKSHGARTVVRVKNQPPQVPPTPPEPERRTRRLTFAGFGLKKARRA